MPFLKHGGLFAPTAQRYSLGDEVVLLVNLADESERLSVVGKVVWISPVGAQGNRTAGIGIHFNESSRCRSSAQPHREYPRRHDRLRASHAHDVMPCATKSQMDRAESSHCK